jgi:hypothetical protein
LKEFIMLSHLPRQQSVKFFKEIVDSGQSRMLTAVLDEVCLSAGIEPDSPEREDAAHLIARLYWEGHRTAEGLKAALDAQLEKEARQYG